jgi:hypothetical protein
VNTRTLRRARTRGALPREHALLFHASQRDVPPEHLRDLAHELVPLRRSSANSRRSGFGGGRGRRSTGAVSCACSPCRRSASRFPTRCSTVRPRASAPRRALSGRSIGSPERANRPPDCSATITSPQRLSSGPQVLRERKIWPLTVWDFKRVIHRSPTHVGMKRA